MTKPKKLSRSTWRQISGDMNPGAYGAIIARWDGDTLILREFQPVREYVSEKEAIDIGYPYWTKEAWLEPGDLDLNLATVQRAIKDLEVNPADFGDDADSRDLAIGEALLRYGRGDEGEAGFGPDVLPTVVYWWHGRGGKQSFAEEDREFRALLREAGVKGIKRTFGGRP